ncbi:MAG TPA: aminotransferase class V-fold PLP-dependent enzyme [Ottowia sp.]|uniref:aminotransferase class V-fold PLP-dependent enzyme n=1 Tax=Ottowia sp. TaxID=1898956 RepID=UPI002B87E4BE|nr:aminotransferase class V-fold PLP-dependent enzyme [Ottowia sp.]HMN22152.1 aminotransferase class V-fold PLP-dependent enzyme [Ottowia sp.]
MPGLLPHIDPDGLLEFSVVYTDRALNHMSRRFQGVMKDISALLKEVYGADATALIPGSGTFGMEAVARQFAGGQRVLIVRNGYFSYRWSQILEAGGITRGDQITVLKARQLDGGSQAPWIPAPIEEVVAQVARERPGVVFVPHVETASGILLPDDYLKQIGDAVHAVGGLFVLDCVASGAVWVDMRALGVDALISAPQKGWSSSPACAMIGLSTRALQVLEGTTSSSFSMDLKKWQQIMHSYETGSHAYHATMPTMALVDLRDTMQETRARGFAVVREQQFDLGRKVRALLAARGFPSVAAPGFAAPGVVVSYTTDPGIQNGRKFIEQGLQSAAGVPLMCDEPKDFSTFRLGLFGLDKWADVDRSVGQLAAALDRMGYPAPQPTAA